MGCARRRSNDAQAQAGADPGRSSIAAEALNGFVGSAPAAIGGPLSRAHPAIMASGDLLPVT